MPRQIILVRHGHTPHNSTDSKQNKLMGWANDWVGLSEEGRLDAAATANKLKDYQIDVIYHSDLKRTTETAQIISHELKMQTTPSPLIRERNLGDFAEHTFHDLMTKRGSDWAKFLDHHDADWAIPEGESLHDVHNRFASMLDHLEREHEDHNVLLITHSGYIHTVLRDHFGFFPKESFIEVHHSSITILEKKDSTYLLTLHNH